MSAPARPPDPAPAGAGGPADRLGPRRPLWDEVGANRRNSVFLLAAFGLLVGALGFLLGEYSGVGPWGLPAALAVAGGMSFASYYYSDSIVLGVSQARPADRQKYPQLVNAVEGLAIAAGIPAPRVFVIEDGAPNAFATGRDPQHAAVCVTTGLLARLDRLELEGVLAHELSHIRNYDVRLVTLAAVLVGSAALLSDWFLRGMRWGMWRGSGRGSRDSGGLVIGLAALLLALLAPLAAQLLRLALSRQREFLADANGALLTRYPEGLASALEKLAADTEPLEVANRATAPLYIVNPLNEYKGKLRGTSLFDTHPPIEERIRRLRAM